MEKVGDQEQQLNVKLNQWFFKISKFSQELLDDLEKLEEWPNKVKIMQKLIGKSFGCEILFKQKGIYLLKILSVSQQDQTLYLVFLSWPFG